MLVLPTFASPIIITLKIDCESYDIYNLEAIIYYLINIHPYNDIIYKLRWEIRKKKAKGQILDMASALAACKLK